MSKDTVDSVLKSISSLNLDKTISDSYTDVAESIRHSGAPSNNTLLTIILSEIRRGNDETMKLTNSIAKLSESMATMTEKLVDSIESQNTILASMKISDDTDTPRQHVRGKLGNVENVWYYKGVKLGSRHHVFACIISQMMTIVQYNIDNIGIQYPDSVDCDFKLMVTMTRVVCAKPCRAKGVEYRSPITLKEMSNQAFDTIYPFVASQDQKFPTTFVESTIGQMINPITRDVMQGVEYVRERLCTLDCVFSVRQIDILKSIKFPFSIDSKINWDPSKIRSRSSHPSTQEVINLASKQKEAFATARMEGKGIIESLEVGQNSKKV